MVGVLRTFSQCERVFGLLVSLGGREAPKALGFFGVFGDASSLVVAVTKVVLSLRMTLRGGEAVEARTFAEVSRTVRETSEAAVRARVSLGGREAPKALGFFGISGDASSRVVVDAEQILSLPMTLRGGGAEEAPSFAEVSRSVRETSEAALRARVSLGGRESPEALGFFGIFGDASSRCVAVAEHILSFRKTLRGGEAEESRSFDEVSRMVRETSEVVLRLCITPIRGHLKELRRLLLVRLDDLGLVTITQIRHRSNIAELHGALVQWYGLIHRFLLAVEAVTVEISQA